MAGTKQGNFEATDFSSSGVFWFSLGVAVMVAASAIVVGFIMHFWGIWPDVGASAIAAPGRMGVSAPQLQTTPAADLQRIRTHEDRILNSYAWSDRQTGVVRIPVERAMELLVQRGLPVRTKPDARAPQPPARTSPTLPPPVQRTSSIGNP